MQGWSGWFEEFFASLARAFGRADRRRTAMAFLQALIAPVARKNGWQRGHDSLGLESLVRGIPPIRSRRGPHRRRAAKLHADKGYAYEHLRKWLRARNIVPRSARRGMKSSGRLGRHRWTVERTVSRLGGCRRLHRRYERNPEYFLAFAAIAATLICSRRITK